MAQAQRTEGERMVALETAYEHVATKADVEAVKTDIQAVKTDVANLRAEVKGDIADLRVELKDDIASLRVELKDDIASLRVELKGDIAGVKDDVASLRTDFVSFQSKIEGSVRTMLRIVSFAIPITAIIVGAVVHFLNQGGI